VEVLPGDATFSEVERLLHPDERSELQSLPVGRRGPEFARLWARKEAWPKARGPGLAHGLGTDPLGVRELSPSGWVVLDVDLGGECAAAVAVAL